MAATTGFAMRSWSVGGASLPFLACWKGVQTKKRISHIARFKLTVQREKPGERDGERPGAASRSMKKRLDQGVLGVTEAARMFGEGGWGWGGGWGCWWLCGWGTFSKPKEADFGVRDGGRAALAWEGSGDGAEATGNRTEDPPGGCGVEERCATGIARRRGGESLTLYLTGGDRGGYVRCALGRMGGAGAVVERVFG
ncbi:hypothetical protein CC85DRAFT_120911 [Cutaneotrichosporon oleaginosum]|uniref:Uncharacterized protein n=1 Tax=Cutaneotrichosporon oleaginosum TaxID=879819 RepID=A0A0J0XK27_9TREE|nr:uncharacterized protein CC85DRAFT_120911 [Cutaneotrichosporon oleaginosum]KLT41422.1 hypothetical protein CC85DRAFT_120911 [Cutaneotrichosporon oleaginosum]